MKFLLITLAVLLAVVNASSFHRPHVHINQKDNVKLVHYAFKNDDRIVIKTIAAKNLEIEPYENWVAKAVFEGDNYNTTG